jgi:hypothetical protein
MTRATAITWTTVELSHAIILLPRMFQPFQNP